MLFTLLTLPLFGVFSLFFIDKTNEKLLKQFSLVWSFLIFQFSIFLLFSFNPLVGEFQLLACLPWFWGSSISIFLGVDAISLSLILLTTFLISVCIILCWSSFSHQFLKEYLIAFFFLEFTLLGVFCSLDLLLFYILFEAVLLPMYFIIGVFGSRDRRVRASYLLFLYTLISSVLMFIAILFLYSLTGTTDYLTLRSIVFEPFVEKLCWLAFFCSFAVKMPLVPFHIWLPEAHSEAPTAGSVILAGILLKLGGFGFLRYSIGLFPDSSAFFTPLVYTISSFGVIYASITTLQQVDLKKIIAYSSVGHMGLTTIGLFSMNSQGVLGAVFLMISHGIVSSALFLCVGFLYERHHTRVIKYYTGLLHTMPLFSTFFLVFTLGNIGLPSTSSFIGEFLILLGCFPSSTWTALFGASGMVLGAGYSLWLCNRILFGNIKLFYVTTFKDLTRLEFSILSPFVFLTFLLGFYPEVLVNFLKLNLLCFQ